ncbi:ATP-dependent zinc metalloprotease FtsH [Saccharicrinis sp. FJH62]
MDRGYLLIMEENNNSQRRPSAGGSRPKPGDKMPPMKPKFNLYWIYGLIAIFLVVLSVYGNGSDSNSMAYGTFKNTILKDNAIKRIDVITNQDKAEIYLKPEKISEYIKDGNDKTPGPHYTVKIPSVEILTNDVDAANEQNKDDKLTDIRYEEQPEYWGSFLSFLPFIVLIVLWFYIMRRMSSQAGGGPGGIFSVGKSKAKLFDRESNIKINFNDVAGLAEAKQEVEEIVSFLKSPQKYTELGGKIPKGALLVGPPGTGKTLLARAVAGEANVPFFSLSGSDFVEMFVGVGASRVRDLFKQAKEKAPCIVFIDEIDAIGRARGKTPNMSSNDERENTLNQLLTEMDGFDTNSGVIILAATNRADILDKALMRAGRFDRQIHVELPDLNERKEIFQVHLRPLKIDESVDSELMAKQTPGFSGADIANVCNEAALIAARKEKKVIQRQDFLDAVDRIIGGLEKRNKIITMDEKKAIAYHEAGHATVSWLLEYAHPLVKVTIVPRGKALGAAWYLPEERQLTTKEQLLDEMCSTLGGRAAEDIVFGRISSGALNDLERVTKSAYGMVSYLGMSDIIGNISYYDSMGGEYSFTKPYSEKTAESIDVEVKKLVDEQYQRAKDILTKNKEGHKKLAEKLLEKEVIFTEDMVEIFGERPWKKEMVKYSSPKKEIDGVSKSTSKTKKLKTASAAKKTPKETDSTVKETPGLEESKEEGKEKTAES